MAEIGHTPGPWEVEDEYVQQAGKPDVGICSVLNMDVGGDKGWFRGPVTEANAHLIAAAPELLEALEQLLTDAVIAQGNMRNAAKRDPRWEGCAEVFQPRVDAARAAIAKATGVQT